MDISGPAKVQSWSTDKYILVIVDDYSRFMWTIFLKSKSETPNVLIIFSKMIQTKINFLITWIRSDHETEFENVKLDVFCEKNGINLNFSAPKTPQQDC